MKKKLKQDEKDSNSAIYRYTGTSIISIVGAIIPPELKPLKLEGEKM